MVAIVGGSKVSTKLTVLESLSEKVDQLVVGGGIANTFLKAAGKNVGKSLCENDLVPTAKMLMDKMAKREARIPIAVDVVVGKKFDANEPAILKNADSVSDDEMIFDIGPKSAQRVGRHHQRKPAPSFGMVRWASFEFDQFGEGTRTIAIAIAESSAFTLAGGGDTIAAIQKYDIYDKISYISTAGGAFLEFLEGKKLPAVEILEQRATPRETIHLTGRRRFTILPLLNMIRRTKIVATLGPASKDPKVLEQMINAGVDVVRINFSHGTREEHIEHAELTRSLARAAGHAVGVLTNLRVPKIRIGKFKHRARFC